MCNRHGNEIFGKIGQVFRGVQCCLEAGCDN